jgi:hypothetical protein
MPPPGTTGGAGEIAAENFAAEKEIDNLMQHADL